MPKKKVVDQLVWWTVGEGPAEFDGWVRARPMKGQQRFWVKQRRKGFWVLYDLTHATTLLPKAKTAKECKDFAVMLVAKEKEAKLRKEKATEEALDGLGMVEIEGDDPTIPKEGISAEDLRRINDALPKRSFEEAVEAGPLD